MADVDETELGIYLREVRRISGLSLREVEQRTDGAVKNGYLSQVETGLISRPSPNVLWDLAETYGVDFNDLMRRAGHRTASREESPGDRSVAGVPLRVMAELDDDDQQALRDFVAYLRSRKKTAT
jgi:transcriptional regulator with XRE-family HTH domain